MPPRLRSTSRACVAVALLALACGACDTSRTVTAPTPPGTGPSPPLRISAFSAAGSTDGTTYVYTPTLTVSVPGEEVVTVTALWVELEGRYNGQGAYVPSPTVPYRIAAGASRQLFENPPLRLETDFDADRMWVVVSYIDERGRTGDIQATTTVIAATPR